MPWIPFSWPNLRPVLSKKAKGKIQQKPKRRITVRIDDKQAYDMYTDKTISPETKELLAQSLLALLNRIERGTAE